MNAKVCFGESLDKELDVQNVALNVTKNAKICSMLTVYRVWTKSKALIKNIFIDSELK
jgi:hypothetical protein